MTDLTWHEQDMCEPRHLPGLYAIYIVNVLIDRWRLVYIGTAKWLDKRLNSSHEIYNRRLRSPYELYYKLRYIKDGRLELEKKLIQRIKPILNKQHLKKRRNGKVPTNIY